MDNDVHTLNRTKFPVIVCFFITVSIIVTYKVITKELIDPDLKRAQIAYETEKVRLEQEKLKRQSALEMERVKLQQARLQRYDDLNFYGTIGILGACGLALIVLAAGYSRAKVKQASVHVARIGQHSAIPIHHNDLQNFYPIAVNLSLAEIEASVSTAHDNAYRISRQMLDDITEYTRAVAGKRGMLALGPGHPELDQSNASVISATPTFAELLRTGTVAPGKPLILGYDRQGQPQSRSLKDLKSLAIAGWQGSGKTMSTGYIVASSVLAYGVQAYIVDPHKNHPESLSTLLKPLESTGRMTVVNPFDTPSLLAELNKTLDRRLSGQEPSSPGILLVMDEMARLAKMDCFDVLVRFLERCTEETRKANITFIGGSHKWTARHFKGRADIRGCMNSMLIHKTKPSQADLLLEDAHDKNLVKQLLRPGDAILVTDYSIPVLVSMPLCSRDDMQTVADRVRQTYQAASSGVFDLTPREQPVHQEEPTPERALDHQPPIAEAQPKPIKAPPVPKPAKKSKPGKRRKLSDVIPFEFHLLRKRKTVHQLTLQMLIAQLEKRKQADPAFTQTEVARRARVSPSHLSQVLKGQRPLSDAYKEKLYKVLFDEDPVKLPALTH